LWEIAESLSPQHHFRVIQFPMNLVEAGAGFEKNQMGNTRSLLEFAGEKKLATLVNRPLNAMQRNGMMRLADFPTISSSEAEKKFPEQIAELTEAEKVFAQKLFRELNFERVVKADRPIFAWSEQLTGGLTLFQNWAHWDHVKQHMIEPQTEMALNFLREKSNNAAVWREWENNYRRCLAAVLDTLSRYHSREAAAASDKLSQRLDGAISQLKTSPALSQKALRVLLNIPELNCVLLGMRRPQYVADGLAALRAERINNVLPALQRF
jgi:hypothetical protein